MGGEGGDRAAALVERLFRDAVGTLELYAVYLGERLGLYRELAESRPAPPSLRSAPAPPSGT